MPCFKLHSDMPEEFYAPEKDFFFKKLHSKFGVEIGGVDLSIPLSSSQQTEIEISLVRHGLLLFRNQALTMDRQAQITKSIGPPISHIVNDFNSKINPAITILSNVIDGSGKLIGADRSGMQWHTDGSFRSEPPDATILYGFECPPIGANTEFCSAISLLSALQADEQDCLAECIGVHDYEFYWNTYQSNRSPLPQETLKATPRRKHPALRTHPVSGLNGIFFMKCMTPLLLGPVKNNGIEVIEKTDEMANCTSQKYSHEWENGDLLIWDNRSMFHRATEFDNSHRRIMHRSSVSGSAPFYSRD